MQERRLYNMREKLRLQFWRQRCDCGLQILRGTETFWNEDASRFFKLLAWKSACHFCDAVKCEYSKIFWCACK